MLTEGTGWTLTTTEVDATRYMLAARLARGAFAGGDADQALARFDELNGESRLHNTNP